MDLIQERIKAAKKRRPKGKLLDDVLKMGTDDIAAREKARDDKIIAAMKKKPVGLARLKKKTGVKGRMKTLLEAV